MPNEKSQDHAEEDAYTRMLRRSEAKEKERTEEARMTELVKKEISRRVEGWVLAISFLVLVIWKGWFGLGIWAVGFFVFVSYEYWVRERTPGVDSENAHVIAESYVRHLILADLHRCGDLRWEVEDGKVVVVDHPEWGTFWSRLETVVPEFEKASPHNRRKRLAKAMKKSKLARIEMMKFAKERNAKPCWWAITESNESL